jgi:hypothetical protein
MNFRLTKHALVVAVVATVLLPTVTSASRMTRAATTTTVTTSSNPSEVHASLTLTATVVSSTMPTGTVKFYGSSTLLGSATLNSAGTAQLTTTSAPVWTTFVRASYGGDLTHLAGNSSTPQVITPHATTTTLSTTFSPAKAQLEITMTAAVSAAPSIDGQPHGTIVLVDSSTTPPTTIGTRSLTANGSVTFPKLILASGTHSITAVYQGQSLFATSSSAALSQQFLPYTYVGAKPFAYIAGAVTDTTNVTKLAGMLVGSPAVGLSWQFYWANLEPAAGTFDWQPVDNAIAASAALHLPVMLRVIAGLNSPAWVLSSVPTVSIPNKYFLNPAPYADPTIVPVGWSSAYLSDWTTFITAFGARYDGNPNVYSIGGSGAGHIADMYLPADMAAWNAAGFTDSVLLGAWEQVISAYAQAFTRTPVNLGVVEPFICSAVSAGFINPTCAAGYQSNVLQPLANWLPSIPAGRIWVQNNGLKQNYISNIFTQRSIERTAAEYTTVGYQMGYMPSTPTLTDLHDSFTVARQDQASYVEVYTKDLLNPAYAAEFPYLVNGT